MEKKVDSGEERLVSLLMKKQLTITTVESLTGGLIAATIVNVPGSSDVLKAAFVTYCDEAKHLLAGVSKETLEKYTAVSSQTAKEMAEGGRRAASADAAISATGIAGPSGGSEEQPVGLVYIAFADAKKTTVKKLLLSGSRREIREQTVCEALALAADCLEE
ncbi:MAG: CinA family protein [Bilifractor sp.]|jgi:nicotinamide-nucleotide amidase